MAFTHLHVHSMYSTFDGMVRIEELFRRAQELGMEGVALTDHGRMYGVPEFLSCAKKYPDIKPIVGCELYICDGPHVKHDRTSEPTYHLLVLAKNLTGYRNLCRLVSLANTEGQYRRKPRICREYLKDFHEGLIVTSACIGGDIPQAILSGNLSRAMYLVHWYKSVFGEDFYLEVSLHESRKPGFPEDVRNMQKKVNEAIFGLGEEYGVKVVATNDVHFLNAGDAAAHDVLLCISTKKTLSDTDRYSYSGQEYLKSEEEMLAVFPDHPEAVANTMEVLGKVERYEICTEPIPPALTVPEKYASSDEMLASLAHDRLQMRQAVKDDAVLADPLTRMENEWLGYELDVVREKGCAWYFLMLKELVDLVREEGITVGPGRGSAPSMLLNYALGLTDVNPTKYGLLPERCFNRYSKSLPDIDFDFSWKTKDGECGRDAVHEICRRQYGEGNVSKVIVFQRRGHAAAIRDVFRAMNLSSSSMRRACNAVPTMCFGNTTFESLLTSDFWADSAKNFRKWYKQASAEEKQAIRIADKLRGLVMGTGIHACATIVCGEELSSLMPMEKNEAGELVSQYDGHYVEDMGPVKLDFLNLRTLDVIDAVGRGLTIPDTCDNSKVFELFADGDTTGIFQFESEGMKAWLRELRADCLDDLVALNALYRPGPMDYIPDYICGKKDPSHRLVRSKAAEEFLSNTYGVPVYQEQAMCIARKYGFSHEEADTFRKALSKNKSILIEEMKPKLFAGAMNAGESREDTEKLWKILTDKGMYLFLESHALSYTILAYKCAWLKVYHPSEFYAASLDNCFDDESRQALIDDAKAHGVQILPPDVNKSGVCPVAEGHCVRLGLGDIQGFGDSLAEKIVSRRESVYPYRDIMDFLQRNSEDANAWALDSLCSAGAFDCFGVERGTYFSKMPDGQIYINVLSDLAMKYTEYRTTIPGTDILFPDDILRWDNMSIAVPEEVETNEDITSSKQAEVLGVVL